MRLVIDKSALELNELRWECLFDPTLSAYITLGDRFSFQRYLSSTDWRSISIRKIDRFSTLLAVASPDNLKDYNLAPLDRSSEAQNLKWVLPGMPLTILPASDGTPVTLNSLYRELREGYDFLYLACHSMLRDGEVYLFFEDELGQADIVSSKELAKSLSQLKRLPRLVVIGGVQTAPLARLLAEAGVPAALAALHYVSIETMREFSQAFFEELLQSGRVDRAAAEACTKVLMSSRPDWWSPVLYTRVREGKSGGSRPSAVRQCAGKDKTPYRKVLAHTNPISREP